MPLMDFRALKSGKIAVLGNLITDALKTAHN